MKRLTAVLLSLTLALALAPPALAAGDEALGAAGALYAQGLFLGTGTDEAGNPVFELDRAPTRHEAAAMLVRLLGRAAQAQQGEWSFPFQDVADWARPYVGYAYANGLTEGMSETAYGGEQPVGAAQFLTLVLRALGYESGKDFSWEEAWVLSDQIGLTNGRYGGETAVFTRGDAAIVFRRALELLRAVSQAKAEVLSAYRDGLGMYNRGREFNLLSLGPLSADDSSYYDLGHLASMCRIHQEYIRYATDHWNVAIELCGSYPQTQVMKEYLTQLVNAFAPLRDRIVTVDNVVQSMALFFPDHGSARFSELNRKIEREIAAWYDATTPGENVG